MSENRSYYIQELTEQIDKKKESRKAVEKLISLGTEGSQNWLTTFQVMAIGAAAVIKGEKTRESGLTILRGIDNWLGSTPFGVIHKTLVPHAEAITQEEAHDQVELRIASNTQNYQMLLEQIDYLDRVLGMPFFASRGLGNLNMDTAKGLKSSLSARTPHVAFLDVMPFPIVHNYARFGYSREKRELLSEMTSKQQDFIVMYNSMRARKNMLDHMTFADQALPLIQEIPGLDDIPPLIDAPIGRITLRELYHAEDDYFLAGYLEFIAKLPKGDLLGRTLRGLAFIPQYGRFVSIPANIFQDPSFTYKIFSAQCTLIDNLILPAASTIEPLADFVTQNPEVSKVDRNVDAGISAAVTNLDLQQQLDFGYALTSAAFHGEARAEMVRRSYGEGNSDSFTGIPLDGTTVISLAATIFKNNTGDTTMRSHDAVIQRFLSQAYPQLQVNWKQRFERTYQKMGAFFQVLHNACELPLDNIHFEHFLGIMKTNLGANFIEQLVKHENELDDINQDILLQLYRQPRKYWPADSVVHSVEFNEKSLGNILGISAVQYQLSGDPTKPVNFILKLHDDKIHIPGTLSPTEEGNKVSLGLEIPKEYRALEILMEHIAVTYFYDLLITSGLAPNIQKTRRKHTQEQEITRNKEKVRNRKIRIPRAERNSETDNTWDSENITTSASQEGDRAIRRITMYVRGVQGSLPFINAIKAHVAYAVGFEKEKAILNPEADEALLARQERRIQEAWETMFKPSDQKIALIERMPQVWRSEIRYIGDRPIDTVVADHWSPRPSDDIIGSPELMYAQYYSAPTASKSAFLDYLSLWMFGEDLGLK